MTEYRPRKRIYRIPIERPASPALFRQQTRQALQRVMLAILLLSWVPLSPVIASEAEEIFERAEDAIFQIRVVHRETGKKNSIGSGFVFSKNNHLATNFHVVAGFIEEPETYRIRYLAGDGREGDLELVSVDAVHDLALLKAGTALAPPLSVADLPAKGAPLYAMGNPLDLGLTIAAGSNGGELGQTDGGRILFSGSLNPGMSGGPTFDREGQVVGINVATARNDISFIVPARYLDRLLDKTMSRTQFLNTIGAQIRDYQIDYLNRIAASDWPATRLRGMQVPGAVSPTVRCWDTSPRREPEHLYRQLTISCENENDIFLTDEINVGKLIYEFIWLESEGLATSRFYRLYQSLNASQFSSQAGEEDVGRFHCTTRFVDIQGEDFKASLCHRPYINHPQLSDILFTAAMIGNPDRGFIFNLDITGTDYSAAVRLIGRFLEEMQWRG